LYFKNRSADDEHIQVIYEKPHARWEVLACLSDGDFQQVSFVNSICTTLGGTHVNNIADQISAHIQGILKKKYKKELKANQVKCKILFFTNIHR
jgi:DNA topoisomerase-2